MTYINTMLWTSQCKKKKYWDWSLGPIGNLHVPSCYFSRELMYWKLMIIYSFCYVKVCSFHSCFLERFYHKWMLNFAKSFQECPLKTCGRDVISCDKLLAVRYFILEEKSRWGNCSCKPLAKQISFSMLNGKIPSLIFTFQGPG